MALPRGVWRFFLAIAAPLRHCCRLDGDAKLLGRGSAAVPSGLALTRGYKTMMNAAVPLLALALRRFFCGAELASGL